MNLSKMKNLVLYFLLIVNFSCNDQVDDWIPEKQENNSFSALQISDKTAICVSYEMETATFIMPKNPQDRDLLSPAEKILGIPKPFGCRVVQMINTDGTIDSDIEMVRYDDMPSFPKRMIGGQSNPEKFRTNKIETRGGVSTHYNSSEEVITTTIQDNSDISFYMKIIQDIEAKFSLSGENIALVIQGFKDAGFETKQSDMILEIEIMKQVFSDGSYTELIIDKNLQLIKGRVNYDSGGNVTTSSIMIYKKDEAGTSKLVGHRFITYYTSPFSGVKMAINKISKICNFSIIKNL